MITIFNIITRIFMFLGRSLINIIVTFVYAVLFIYVLDFVTEGSRKLLIWFNKNYKNPELNTNN